MGSLSGADSRAPQPCRRHRSRNRKPVLPNALGRRAIVIFPRNSCAVQPHEMRAARAEIRDNAVGMANRSRLRRPVRPAERCRETPRQLEAPARPTRNVGQQDGLAGRRGAAAQIEAARSRSDSGIVASIVTSELVSGASSAPEGSALRTAVAVCGASHRADEPSRVVEPRRNRLPVIPLMRIESLKRNRPESMESAHAAPRSAPGAPPFPDKSRERQHESPARHFSPRGTVGKWDAIRNDIDRQCVRRHTATLCVRDARERQIRRRRAEQRRVVPVESADAASRWWGPAQPAGTSGNRGVHVNDIDRRCLECFRDFSAVGVVVHSARLACRLSSFTRGCRDQLAGYAGTLPADDDRTMAVAYKAAVD